MSTQPLTILLLRHGQTDANAAGVIQGHLPTPLNDLGHEQASRLARRLSTEGPHIDVLVSSDLKRAAQTAEPIAEACGIPVIYDSAWRERYLGTFQGKTVGERGIWLAATGASDSPGAENVDAMLVRVHRALSALPVTYPDAKTIAVVTHGGPCTMVLRLLHDGRLPTEPGVAPPEPVNAGNCAVMRLRHNRGSGGGTWAVECVNDVTHLDGMLTARDAG